MTDQNRHGIDTGGTPGLRMTVLFGLVSLPSEFQPRKTEQNRHGIDTGGTPVRNDREFGECNDSFPGVGVENMAKYTRNVSKKQQKSQLNNG